MGYFLVLCVCVIYLFLDSLVNHQILLKELRLFDTFRICLQELSAPALVL